jgi:hypothetical protein
VNTLDFFLLAVSQVVAGCVGWTARSYWDEYRQTGREDR